MGILGHPVIDSLRSPLTDVRFKDKLALLDLAITTSSCVYMFENVVLCMGVIDV